MWEEDQGPKTPFAAAIGRFVAARQSLAEALAAARANEFVVGRVNVVGSDVENAAELLDTIHDQARDAYAAMYAESEDDPVTKVLRDPKYVHGSDDALAEAWQAAINSESAEARLARIKRSFRLTFRPTRRLATAYKAFFFFVRAYQDVMYCLLNKSSSGSMGSAFKNDHNPIRVTSTTTCPAMWRGSQSSGGCETRSKTASEQLSAAWGLREDQGVWG
jgi:hypothetical protein